MQQCCSSSQTHNVRPSDGGAPEYRGRDRAVDRGCNLSQGQSLHRRRGSSSCERIDRQRYSSSSPERSTSQRRRYSGERKCSQTDSDSELEYDSDTPSVVHIIGPDYSDEEETDAHTQPSRPSVRS